jgi:hypothetical protein
MAKEPRRRQPPDALKIDIARSRDEVAREFRGLRYELDIPRKIRRSFREQTGLWIGAAVVVGTLIVLLPLRKRKVYVDLATGKKGKAQNKLLETGFILGALRVAAALLKPTVTSYLAKRMGRPTVGRERSMKW